MKITKKVWGHEELICNNELYCGKKLVLKQGFQCSLHWHKEKDETFYIQSGTVKLEIKDGPWPIRILIMSPGDNIRIEPTTIHRFTGINDSEIIEFSTHHEDSDSYRIEESRKVKDET